jgi:hypothetical protein
MNSDYIYEEKIFAKVIGGMIGAATAILFIILIYQVSINPSDEVPWLPVVILISFIIFLFLTLNFIRLVIRVTYQDITVRYGIFRRRIGWENIEDAYIDDTPAIKYGGAGIRTARITGEWVLVYNVVGGPRCVLKLKEGRFKRFVFSTKNPEEVINVIRGQLVLT